MAVIYAMRWFRGIALRCEMTIEDAIITIIAANEMMKCGIGIFRTRSIAFARAYAFMFTEVADADTLRRGIRSLHYFGHEEVSYTTHELIACHYFAHILVADNIMAAILALCHFTPLTCARYYRLFTMIRTDLFTHIEMACWFRPYWYIIFRLLVNIRWAVLR